MRTDFKKGGFKLGPEGAWKGVSILMKEKKYYWFVEMLNGGVHVKYFTVHEAEAYSSSFGVRSVGVPPGATIKPRTVMDGLQKRGPM